MFKKVLLVALFVFTLSVARVSAVEFTGGCTALGQCVNNKYCTQVQNGSNAQVIGPFGSSCGSSQLGGVRPPVGADQYVSYENGSYTKSGLINFMSRLLRFFVVICGIWTLFNFLLAGWAYIYHQSEPKAAQEVKDKLTMTLIGLVLLASAFTLAGLTGTVFFKDASFILSPAFKGALDFAAESK